MQITFYDKNMFETAVADNALMNAIKIKKASLTSLFEEATHQVEFEFSKEFGEWWGIKENGYLAFRFKGDFFRFSIVKFKEDAKTNTITIIGDYFNLEMLNENCITYEKQPARTIVQHLTAMEILPYANFEIGINELASSSRVLAYTGDEVKYKRLISTINNFGGECEFEIKQKANGQFDKLILNIYKANDGVNYQGVGRNRRDLEITIDNSNNVSRMVDSTEIKTSIEPIGKDGLRLGNRGTTWKNEDGQVEFYQKNNRIYAPLAADEMQRVLDSDKFLLWKQSIDTDNVAKLESEGLKWLKNVCYAKENIEVSGSFDVRVGDTVILNHKGIGKYGILGSLRVTKIVWDLLTETNEVTFSNFKRLASKISAQGLALQNSIESPASYDITFNSTGGTVFKNNTGASNVSFNFSKNGAQTAVLGARWYKGTQLLSNGLEVMVKPDKLVDDKLVLRLEVDVTDSITYSKELTFINVNDGVKGDQGNGITSTENYYIVSPNKTGITTATSGWVRDIPQIASPTNKYHWHYHVDIYSNGTRKETIPAIIGIYGDKGSDGNDGISITNTVTTNALATSGTTAPTSGWSATMPTLIKGQFLWTKIELTLSDSTTKTSYFVTYIPNDGINGQTPVVHTAYSNSQNGAVDFSITDSSGRRFIGQYVDYSTTNSTDYTKYKWIDMVGSVKVGNKNLILKSNDLANPHKQNGTNTTVTSTDDYFVIKSTGYTSNGWGGMSWNMSISEVKAGEEFSILMPVYIDSSVPLDNGWAFFLKNHSLNSGAYSYDIPTNKKDQWFNVAITFKAYKDVVFDVYPFYVYLNKNGLVRIKPPMLVRGNVIPSDYVSAPEDIDAKIDTKADQLLTQQQILALEEKTTLERENAIAEAMQNTISEVEQKWQLWYDTNTKDEKQKVANDIASLMQRTAELDYKLGEASAKFSFINNETIIGEDGVAIGDKAGKAKLFMSGDSISFLTNGVAQMTLTGDTLSIKNGLFTERIQIGNFVEEVYDKNPLFNVTRAIKNS